MSRRARVPAARSPIMAIAERALDLGAVRGVLVYVYRDADGDEVRRVVSTPDLPDLAAGGLLAFAVADLAAGTVEVEGDELLEGER